MILYIYKDFQIKTQHQFNSEIHKNNFNHITSWVFPYGQSRTDFHPFGTASPTMLHTSNTSQIFNTLCNQDSANVGFTQSFCNYDDAIHLPYCTENILENCLERKTGFEPATFSLEGWRSTNWVTSAYFYHFCQRTFFSKETSAIDRSDNPQK